MVKKLFTLANMFLTKDKLSKNILYTMGSFFVLAISGIIINIVIAAFRDPAALGVFNLTYAFYIIFSQFAVCGVQYSVLRHTAYHHDDPATQHKLLQSAALITFVLGVISAIFIHALEPIFFYLFKNPDVIQSIQYASLGLIFFPLNKVLISYINAIHHMKIFSILQSLRYIIVMIFVTVIALSHYSIKYASLSFLCAEIITCTLALQYLHKKQLIKLNLLDTLWIKKHLIFGSKGLMTGIFVELNSRLDILVIGAFLSDSDVGIYSFVAMLVDGLFHVLAMIKVNFNPILVNHIRDENWDKLLTLRRSSQKYLLPIMSILALGVLAAYIILANWVIPDKGLMGGLGTLLILLGGLITVSCFSPFDNLLLVSGYPGYQTIQQVLIVFFNISTAVILLKLNAGIKGAAIATVVGNIMGILVLMYFAKRFLGWRLFKNQFIRKDYA